MYSLLYSTTRDTHFRDVGLMLYLDEPHHILPWEHADLLPVADEEKPHFVDVNRVATQPPRYMQLPLA